MCTWPTAEFNLNDKLFLKNGLPVRLTYDYHTGGLNKGVVRMSRPFKVFGALSSEGLKFLEEFFEGGKEEFEQSLALVLDKGHLNLKKGVRIEIQIPLIVFTLKASAQTKLEGMSLVSDSLVEVAKTEKGKEKFFVFERFKLVEKYPAAKTPQLAIVPTEAEAGVAETAA